MSYFISVAALLDQRSLEYPSFIALSDGNNFMTYKELSELSSKIAKCLISLNVKKEDIVALMTSNRIEGIVLIYSIIKAGAAFFVLNLGQPAKEIKRQIKEVNPKLIITDNGYDQNFGPYKYGKFLVKSYGELVKNIEEVDDFIKLPRIEKNNLSYIIYTSGSTGKPKGVLIEHKGLTPFITFLGETYGIKPAMKYLQLGELCFDMSISEYMTALSFGAEVVCVHGDHKIDNLLYFLEHKQLDVAILLPNLASSVPISYMKNLKVLNLVGDCINSNLISKLIKSMRLFNAYGPTESTVCTTIFECTEKHPPNTIGKPLPSVQAFVMDDNFKLVEGTDVGILFIAGEALARGYLNNPSEFTKHFLLPEEHKLGDFLLYKTGDLVRYNEDGYLEFIGRKDRQVKIRGYRVELEEIKVALEEIDGCVNAAAIVLEYNSAKYIVACYVGDITEEQIKIQLQHKLSQYKVPHYIFMLQSMPLTHNGKINHLVLEDLVKHRIKFNDKIEADSSNDLQNLLIEAFEEVLKCKLSSTEDNFFELGGDSISAIKLVSVLRKHGLSITIADFFKFSCVSDLENYFA